MTTLDEIQARHEKEDATYKARCSCCTTPASHVDRGKLVAALRAVEAVHQSDGHKQLIGPYCTHCVSPIDGGPELWPCKTLVAIAEALG